MSEQYIPMTSNPNHTTPSQSSQPAPSQPSQSTYQQPTYGYQYGASAPTPSAAVPLATMPTYYPPQPQPFMASPSQPVAKAATRGWTKMEQDVSQRHCSSYCTCYYFLSFRGILRLLQLILTIVSFFAMLPNGAADGAPSFAATAGILAVIAIWLFILIIRLFLTTTGRLEIILNMVTDIVCALTLFIVISVATAACNAKSTTSMYSPYYPYYYNYTINGWCTSAAGSGLPVIAGLISTYVLSVLFVISAIVHMLRYRQWRPQPQPESAYVSLSQV